MQGEISPDSPVEHAVGDEALLRVEVLVVVGANHAVRVHHDAVFLQEKVDIGVEPGKQETLSFFPLCCGFRILTFFHHLRLKEPITNHRFPSTASNDQIHFQ